jgi:hypothetical protein
MDTLELSQSTKAIDVVRKLNNLRMRKVGRILGRPVYIVFTARYCVL